MAGAREPGESSQAVGSLRHPQPRTRRVLDHPTDFWNTTQYTQTILAVAPCSAAIYSSRETTPLIFSQLLYLFS